MVRAKPCAAPLVLLITAIRGRCTTCSLIPITLAASFCVLNNAHIDVACALRVLEDFSCLPTSSCVTVEPRCIRSPLPAESEHDSMLSECSNVGLLVTESSNPRNHFAQPPLLTFISTWVSLAYVAKRTSLPVFRP